MLKSISLYNARLLLFTFFWAVSQTVSAACNKESLPYDAERKPKSDINQAISALGKRQLVLLTFGANWCKDCRVFDKALCADPLKSLVKNKAEVVKVDIGQWDHNQDIVKQFGNPTEKGIPAIVIIDKHQNILTAARGGELAKARSMSQADIEAYLSKLLNNAEQSLQVATADTKKPQ